jgi:hypothetical protein
VTIKKTRAALSHSCIAEPDDTGTAVTGDVGDVPLMPVDPPTLGGTEVPHNEMRIVGGGHRDSRRRNGSDADNDHRRRHNRGGVSKLIMSSSSVFVSMPRRWR